MDETSPAIEGAGEHIGESSVPVRQLYTFDGVRYVTYDDHLRAVLNPLHHRLTKDDAATFNAFQFILDNTADLEQDEHFAGYRLERVTDKEEKLLYLRFVPCDNLGGVTVPRVV